LVKGILDGGQSSNDSLRHERISSQHDKTTSLPFLPHTHGRVGDLVGLLVLRNVKVDSDEDLFSLEGDIGDSELARERHLVDSTYVIYGSDQRDGAEGGCRGDDITIHSYSMIGERAMTTLSRTCHASKIRPPAIFHLMSACLHGLARSNE
jgi:hypothetical protein